MITALEGGEWSAVRPGRTLPPGKSRYPLYEKLGGSHGQSGRAENLTPPGFDPRTVQPVPHSLIRSLEYWLLSSYSPITAEARYFWRGKSVLRITSIHQYITIQFRFFCKSCVRLEHFSAIFDNLTMANNYNIQKSQGLIPRRTDVSEVGGGEF
jgi:hypothetical protein